MNNTLVKGLALLEILARSQQPVGITEMARCLGVAKSNVHRLLQALVELQYARREEPGTYRPSVRLLSLGSAVEANFDLKHVAAPSMQWLRDETHETVHLSVLEGDNVVYVEKLDSTQPVRAYSQVGGHAPAHCVATGKAMLAFQDPEYLARCARRLKPFSPRTITDVGRFLAEMARIAQAGYAVNRGEWRETVRGVAAPILDPTGRVLAAIGISGPAERIKPAMYPEYGRLVIKAAAVVSAAFERNRSTRTMENMVAGMRRARAAGERVAGVRKAAR